MGKYTYDGKVITNENNHIVWINPIWFICASLRRLFILSVKWIKHKSIKRKLIKLFTANMGDKQ